MATVAVVNHDSDARITDIHAADVADTEVEGAVSVSHIVNGQVAGQHVDAAERIQPETLQTG